MLSFDITDRNVRIIKGTETNGKIKIQSSATLDLDENVIIRGIPKDPVMLATELNQILKARKMTDKEAIMSISSNHTIFKELSVPYVAKSSEFAKAVADKMQESVSVVDDTYSISYIIIKNDANLKDSKEDNSTSEVTVLATACPHEIIDSYKVVFQYLNISLKSIVVANNCITKVLLADAKLKQKMPFMAVQIDNNFISMNVYQDNQLSFSRFASIDESDYSENSQDYIMDAIHDNVFRMLQFQRNRSSEPIKHIVFYGDTSERYRELADDMEQMGLSSSVITVPPLISGYENLEFSNYANAIGAMFKRDKETEKINLLELGGGGAIAVQVGDDKKFGILLGAVGGGAVAIVAVISIILGTVNASLTSQINKCDEYINSQEAVDGLAKHDNRTAMLESVRAYKDAAKVAADAYKSRPILASDTFTKLQELATSIDASIKFGSISYDSGMMTIQVTANGGNVAAQTIPSALAKSIADDGTFYNVDYVGYNLDTATSEPTTVTNPDGTVSTIPGTEQKTISFQLVVYLKNDIDSIVSDYEITNDTSNDTDAVNGEESSN